MDAEPTDKLKRRRSPSASSSSSSSSAGSSISARSALSAHSASSRPTPKYHRRSPPPAGPDARGESYAYLCTLPPTCSQPSTAQAFASARELARHQDAFHRFVCRVAVRDRPGRDGALVGAPGAGGIAGAAEGRAGGYGGEGSGAGALPGQNQSAAADATAAAARVPEQFHGRKTAFGRWRECGKVFPDGRLLELHEVETHDPLALARQRRGERIFQCFLPPEQCGKVCKTPKSRRSHMVEKHHYPKSFFFAVTNHGINEIARADGLGASLIRPRRDWPPAPGPASEQRTGAPAGATHPAPPALEGAATDEPLVPSTSLPAAPRAAALPAARDGGMDVDDLAEALGSSLAFVPRTVRRKAAAASPGGAQEVQMA